MALVPAQAADLALVAAPLADAIKRDVGSLSAARQLRNALASASNKKYPLLDSSGSLAMAESVLARAKNDPTTALSVWRSSMERLLISLYKANGLFEQDYREDISSGCTTVDKILEKRGFTGENDAPVYESEVTLLLEHLPSKAWLQVLFDAFENTDSKMRNASIPKLISHLAEVSRSIHNGSMLELLNDPELRRRGLIRLIYAGVFRQSAPLEMTHEVMISRLWSWTYESFVE